MMFEVLARHERDDGTEIVVGRGRHDDHKIVFDALGGLETTIEFTAVDVTDRTIELKYSPYTSGKAESTVATLERDDFGDVEAFLEAFGDDVEVTVDA